MLGQPWCCWSGVHSLSGALVFASGAEELPLSPSEQGAEGGGLVKGVGGEGRFPCLTKGTSDQIRATAQE